MSVYIFKSADEFAAVASKWEGEGYWNSGISMENIDGQDCVVREFRLSDSAISAAGGVSGAAAASLEVLRKACYPMASSSATPVAPVDTASVLSSASEIEWSDISDSEGGEPRPSGMDDFWKGIEDAARKRRDSQVSTFSGASNVDEDKVELSNKLLQYVQDSGLEGSIQKDPYTKHEYLAELSAGKSSFIFIPNGDRNKMVRIHVKFVDTGDCVTNPRDFKHMIMCFAAFYSSGVDNWKSVHIPLFAAKMNSKEGVSSDLLSFTIVIDFRSSEIIVYNKPDEQLAGFNIFKGTKLKIDKNAEERINEIMEHRERARLRSEGVKVPPKTEKKDE